MRGSDSRSDRSRGGGRSAALTEDARPALASGVAFEQSSDGAVWIAMLHGVPSSRVSPHVVDLLTAMDGDTALRDLHRRFAAAESWESFLQLVVRVRASGLLDGHSARPSGRLAFRPPLTLQVATLRAPALFDRLRRLVPPLPPRVVLASLAVVLGLGLVAAMLQAAQLWSVLSAPVPLSALLALVAVLSVLTLLHESAHGITLANYGGRPRRAGVMLFYLTPAFFVDVTDGWRLAERRQRVAVALAGPAVHAVVAAIALIAALAVPHPPLHRTLLLLGLSSTAIVVVNLIPFVRFDGYIALMSALDEPNLRGRAIHDGTDLAIRVLFGGRRRARRLDRWWSVPFGLASLLAPAVLVVLAVGRIAHALAGGGPIAGLLVMALEATVVLVALVMLVRSARRILRSGVSRLRFVAIVVALLAGAGTVGAVVPIPLTATLGFLSLDDRVVLVRAGTDRSPVPEGAAVTLLSSGILANERVGVGTTGPARAEPAAVALEALLPVTADAVTVPAVIIAEVEVSRGRGSLPPTGQARVELGTRNLWTALWEAAVAMPSSSLRGEK
ncbi:daptide biosynthesis intramembrane metalloprotease [Microbacterium sp. H83]|uniref:daptide biosynthesis intramembrane metalloprotease n=1 Tax=Microbacterium sp. H83 TaxID=1827324 RepID=UPI0007F4642B|nr:daptide biosynthesis intramembrane metalloprotease [Microbacterium sp. H83]OAN36611.1 hypothetical protein A4X16_04195 [Microbacterium sp. H83]